MTTTTTFACSARLTALDEMTTSDRKPDRVSAGLKLSTDIFGEVPMKTSTITACAEATNNEPAKRSAKILTLSSKLVTANIASNDESAGSTYQSISDVYVRESIEELAVSFETTVGLSISSRDALYEFLGKTYEAANVISKNTNQIAELRDYVRGIFVGKKEKTSVAKKVTFDLLLIACIGTGSASLRSKYLKILKRAEEALIPRNTDAFKVWLRSSGGVVKAQQALLEFSATVAPKKSVPTIDIDTVIADLTVRNKEFPPSNERCATEHNGFSVVLYYTDPTTGKCLRVSEVSELNCVRSVLRAAHNLI